MVILYKYRYISFALIIICAALLAPHLKDAMAPNNSLRIWFYNDDPTLKAYEQSLLQFGNDEVIIIYYEIPGNDLLSKENLLRVEGLTRDIGSVKYIHRVFSLTNLKDIKYENGQVQSGNLVPEHFELNKAQKRKVMSKLLNDPVFGGTYISKSKKGVLITAQLKAREDIDKVRDEITNSVILILEKRLKNNGIEYHIGGVGVLYTFLNKLTTEDSRFFLGISYLIMFVLIAILLRSFWGLVITIVVIVLTSFITLGIFGATSHQINLMTVVLPTLVAILAIADCIHILSHHRLEIMDRISNKETILKSMSYIIVPCFLNFINHLCRFFILMRF